MRKSQLKPWLNKDGNIKSDAELRKAGQNWLPSVWEEYLATIEVRRKEDIILPPCEGGRSKIHQLSEVRHA